MVRVHPADLAIPITASASSSRRTACSREEMVQHIRQTRPLPWRRGPWEIPPSNKRVGCFNHRPSTCSAWLGHVQLTALPSWKPQLGLTVMCLSMALKREARCCVLQQRATCRLSLSIFMRNSSALRKPAGPHPVHQAGSCKIVTNGQLSSPCRLATLSGTYDNIEE